MPTLDDYLHYRMIDVSSIKELCRRWYPRIYFGQPAKGMTHRALADIPESIRELRYYRAPRSSTPPGPADQRYRRHRGRARAGRRWRRSKRFGFRSDQRLRSTTPRCHGAAMVAVVQLVEHQVVILAVAGSSPVSHPE